jgi:hypothetical protein
MTQELTISQYKNGTSIGYEILIGFFFICVYSGLTLLAIYIFKFADKTTPTKTGEKRKNQYFNELGVSGIVTTYISLAVLTYFIYSKHHRSDDKNND